jgi:hypothetical protein
MSAISQPIWRPLPLPITYTSIGARAYQNNSTVSDQPTWMESSNSTETGCMNCKLARFSKEDTASVRPWRLR